MLVIQSCGRDKGSADILVSWGQLKNYKVYFFAIFISLEIFINWLRKMVFF